MIHVSISHDPNEPTTLVVRDNDVNRVIYRGPSIIAAQRERREYIARINQT
jgi:hypothetical protein